MKIPIFIIQKAFEFPIDLEQPWLPIMAQAYVNALNALGRPEEAIAFFTPVMTYSQTIPAFSARSASLI